MYFYINRSSNFHVISSLIPLPFSWNKCLNIIKNIEYEWEEARNVIFLVLGSQVRDRGTPFVCVTIFFICRPIVVSWELLVLFWKIEVIDVYKLFIQYQIFNWQLRCCIHFRLQMLKIHLCLVYGFWEIRWNFMCSYTVILG